MRAMEALWNPLILLSEYIASHIEAFIHFINNSMSISSGSSSSIKGNSRGVDKSSSSSGSEVNYEELWRQQILEGLRAKGNTEGDNNRMNIGQKQKHSNKKLESKREEKKKRNKY
jgi:hypothetical protein